MKLRIAVFSLSSAESTASHRHVSTEAQKRHTDMILANIMICMMMQMESKQSSSCR